MKSYGILRIIIVSLAIMASQPHMIQAKTRNCLVLPGICTGMFSNFSSVLGVLEYFERGNCAGVIVNFQPNHSLYYQEEHGTNWWEYYFEPITIGRTNTTHQIIDPTCQVGKFSVLGRWALSTVRANYLINKYIKVKPHISSIVNAFYDEYMKGKYIIGVHYRGTDHYMEVKLAKIEDVIDIIQRKVAELPRNQKNNFVIFIATDTQQFIDAILNTNLRNHVIFCDQLRSTNDTGVHNLSEKNNYLKGQEALVDCLLLSKSNLLIRTSSLLSTAAIQFNPTMQVINLNGPEAKFWNIHQCPSAHEWTHDPLEWKQTADPNTFLPKEFVNNITV